MEKSFFIIKKHLPFIKSIFIAFLFFNSWLCNAQQNDTVRIIRADTMKKEVTIKEVVVIGTKTYRANNTYNFDLKDIKPLVTVMGETDVLRYIGTIPGVSQGLEGGLGFFVRGSNSSNNRIELDQVPVYGSAHLFGLFSVFPPDIVENVTFRNGKIPASSGDLLASLTQISSHIPQSDKYKGSFSISPFMVSGVLSGPVLKNKLTFQVSGRFSLLGTELKLAKSLFEMEGEFYPEVADLFAGMYYRINDKNMISISGYYSNDYFKYRFSDMYQNNTIEENWGNKILRLSWNSQMNSYWKLHAIAYSNTFLSLRRQQSGTNNIQKNDVRLQTSLNEMSAQIIFNYQKEKNTIDFGLQGKLQEIKPVSEKFNVGYNGEDKRANYNESFTSSTIAVYGDWEYTYNFLTPSAGYRGTLYQMGNYNTWDNNIRLALAIITSKETGLELSYDQFSQFHHVVEGLPVGWSLDMIFPADSMFIPEKARQYYIGGFWTNKQFLLSSGIYYKQMKNLVSYINAINIFGIQYSDRVNEVAIGEGSSYGLEFRAERKGEDWNGAISYTLSKTDRLFDKINNGKRFPFKFDRRHIINFTGQILTRKRKSNEQHLNLSAAFSSGNQITLPIGMYQGIIPPAWNRMLGIYIPSKESDNIYYRQLMSEVNGYTLPYYLRMDVSYSFQRTGKHFTNELVLGLFNVLNRKNPYLIFFDEDRWKQLSIFPIIPSIKWTFSFL